MEPSREEILKAMEQVIDPELKRNVVELDMVRDVRIEGGDVTIGIALTIAGCPPPRELRGTGRSGPRTGRRRGARGTRVRRDDT
jgi:metal-sulfur cluster biosynthetic enzyme